MWSVGVSAGGQTHRVFGNKQSCQYAACQPLTLGMQMAADRTSIHMQCMQVAEEAAQSVRVLINAP
jgi:hypothetical protein